MKSITRIFDPGLWLIPSCSSLRPHIRMSRRTLKNTSPALRDWGLRSQPSLLDIRNIKYLSIIPRDDDVQSE